MEKTSRTRIALLGPADATDFLAAARGSRRLHGRWVSAPQTPEAFKQRLEQALPPSNYLFTIRRADNDALAGYVAVTNVVRGNFLSAYASYYGFAGHERQGLMTSGLRQVVRYVFDTLGLHRIEANMQPDNTASIALARACGFRREGLSPRYLKINGRWRDHERWAILKDAR